MGNTRVVNLGSYEKPKVTENKRKNWVEYGEDNDYFSYLIDAYENSTTNNAVITGIANQIYGSGLDSKDKDRKVSQWTELMAILDPDCLKKALLDMKLLGQASFQIIWNVGKNSVQRIEHWPVETLRPVLADDEGVVSKYYYAPDWTKVGGNNQPDTFPAFKQGGKTELSEIYYIKPYSPGHFYFAPVDYQGSVPYAVVEKEVASFHINNILNGFSADTLINFNNGVPDDKKQVDIEKRIARKFSGSSNAGKFIIQFNDNKETSATIESVPSEDRHKQYEFIAAEAQEKIMIGHRVTSPMLLGIKDKTGLGNNAEELQTAMNLFEATVINPYRMTMIDALESILHENGISLRLHFGSLNPFSKESETTQKQETLADDRPFLDEKTEGELSDIIEELGESEEDLLSDFEMIEAEIAEGEPEGFDAEKYINSRDDLAAQDESEQDTDRFKVRYAYVKGTRKQAEGQSRRLCQRLLSAGRVYRKEDILRMSSSGGAEKKNTPYSVWLYKGGANCHHRWERRVYRKRLKKNGEPWGGEPLQGTRKIGVNQAIRQGFKPDKNPDKVAIAPIDTATKGYKS